MSRQKWVGWMTVFAVMLLVISGCSLMKSGDEANGIDPPPSGSNLGWTDWPSQQVNVPEEGSQKQNTMEVTLYFEDAEGFVVPLSMRIPASESVARRSLEYMVEDGPGQGLLPEGFRALLPKGTMINPIDIDQKLATVDFSEQFASYNSSDERKIIEAITWTLTGFQTIDKVKLRINGEELKEMPVNGTPMDEPLTRAMGVNLERVKGVDYGQSTPVTLYFQNKLLDGYTYYVPVTRMVERTEDVIEAALNELIRGPLEEKGLLAVMGPATELLLVDSDIENDMITVNFSEQLLDGDQIDSAYAYESVVMSLWENVGKKQIRIMVNGEARPVVGDLINRQLNENKSKM